MSIFKRQWISQGVIDYLMSLPLMYRIFYRVQANKDYVASFLFRDNDGKLIADLFAQNVVGIDIHYQDALDNQRIYVDGTIGDDSLDYVKKKVAEFMEQFPATQSNLRLSTLLDMQYKLREKIEDAILVQAPKKGEDPNIDFCFNNLSPAGKRRVVEFLMRLDEKCIPVSLCMHITLTTDEQIGATLDEVAMYEMEREELENQNSDEEGAL